MFGYILPDKPELKIKEYELFRAYYCGVCKAMGKSFGMISRLALNYDSVFLGLLLSSLSMEAPSLKKETCLANPLKKKWIVKDNKYLDYVADINVLFTYYKLKDDWNDERKLASLFSSTAFRGGFRRVKAKNTYLYEQVEKSIIDLSELEKKQCASMDRAAEPFAKALGNILSIAYTGEDKATEKALNWLGYNLGRWIYLIDAYDDIQKDKNSKSYNPMLLQYQCSPTENIDQFKYRIKDEVNFNLVYSMGQVASSVELLNMSNKGIIENIVYLGMYKKMEQIMGSSKTCGNNAVNIEQAQRE